MTAKKCALLILSFVLMLTLCRPIYASGGAQVQPVEVSSNGKIAMPSFDLPCKNAILISADTSEVLYEKAADAPVPIASITKVMTLLLTFEAIESGKIAYSDYVPISALAYSMGGSQIWLEPGEQFTLEELLKAICVSSANDAAVAVAEYVGGSERVFVDMMNKRAAELGMTNTCFKNACGLDADNHLSSARDVATMSCELLKHEDVLKFTTIWMDTLRGGATQLLNTNKLLKRYTGINGLKTGTTGKAGVCISASAVRDDMGLIAVVLGSATGEERFASAMELLDYGFANYETAPLPNVNGRQSYIAVRMGKVKEVKLNYAVPTKILVKKGESTKLTAMQSLPEAIDAPILANTKVGCVVINSGGEKLAEYPIFTEGDVEKMNFSAAMSLLLDGLFNM